jgi:metacaspase-1
MLRIIFIFLISGSLFQLKAQIKQALIISIGDYPENGGWKKLSSKNDVIHLTNALENQGFKKVDITIISDSLADIIGIKNGLKIFENKVKKNDVAFIHFSGHGEQLESKDKYQIDGLDECFVSYDAISPAISNDYEKNEYAYLRGNELGSYLNKIRTKLGKAGDLFVTMDLCHSGGGTRGTGKVRGGQPPLVSKTYNSKKHLKSDSSYIIRNFNKIYSDLNLLSSFEVISATRPEEFDLETVDDLGLGIGSLSYAIAKSFSNLEPNTTYRKFFSKIQNIMSVKVPSQHPLLEGDGSDRLIFGGAYVEQKPYFEIVQIEKNKDLIVRAGIFSGLTVGSIVEIFKSGTIDPLNSVKSADGTISKIDNYFSTIKLNSPLEILKNTEFWVFVLEKKYLNPPINIALNSQKKKDNKSFTNSEMENIQFFLEKQSNVLLKGPAELLLIKGINKDSLKIANTDLLFSLVNNILKDTIDFKEKIQRYNQYKFLKELEIKDRAIDVDIKLIPIINGKVDHLAVNSKIKNGIYEFYEGDTLTISITNNGSKNIYINILDLQPDGIINAILPNKAFDIYPNEIKIQARTQFTFPIERYFIVIAPPYGDEVFKIFACISEIDVENIATNKGENTKGNLSVLENMVQKSYKIKSNEVVNYNNVNGSISTLLFRIIPKQ